MRKNILIEAYTASNLGDDLFIKILCERYPYTNFYLACKKKYSEAFINIPNLEIISPIPYIDTVLSKIKVGFSVNEFIRRKKMKKYDAVVHIGGSIFMQIGNWKKRVEYLHTTNTIYNIPSFFIGCNFGPFVDQKFYDDYKNVFSEAADICFRDSYSYELFKEIPNVRLAPDVVFSLSDAEGVESQNTVVISVIDLENRVKLKPYKVDYVNKITEIAKEFIKNDYNVNFISFCEAEGDEQTIKEIMNELDSSEKKYIDAFYYKGDINKALSVIKKSQYVISTRFHAMILGWKYNKIVYPLIYSDKTYNVIKDTNFLNGYTWIENIRELDVSNLFKQVTNATPHVIDNEVRNSEEHFSVLDAFINKVE
ncbi:polysaccharide pyruvyl transferase family protein [Atopococcus tabaci]|uniref:polysaccharide pyruvyl transferase family protein n=1 Tax=Atopococcus tabaci TaxID=269774 RepID=UPI00041E99EF|nr:polysaccharide pyruvyl transferase family protein [Atopococcus tabaci]